LPVALAKKSVSQGPAAMLVELEKTGETRQVLDWKLKEPATPGCAKLVSVVTEHGTGPLAFS
jgi:hypothetical protein